MRLNILIGGKAGQGINKVSGIVSQTLMKHGYYVFNYRDYPSIIRGGHNFNVLSVSDKPISSHESKIDGIVALDSNTIKVHKQELRKGGFVISYKPFLEFGLNANIALSGALMKILGIKKDVLMNELDLTLKHKAYYTKSVEAAETGYESQKSKYNLKKLNNKDSLLRGSKAISLGAINSKIDLYIGYPMTTSTNALHELAPSQIENIFIVLQD